MTFETLPPYISSIFSQHLLSHKFKKAKMASILETFSNYFARKLQCQSDDCIVPTDDDSPSVAPLIDIAIGKLS